MEKDVLNRSSQPELQVQGQLPGVLSDYLSRNLPTVEQLESARRVPLQQELKTLLSVRPETAESLLAVASCYLSSGKATLAFQFADQASAAAVLSGRHDVLRDSLRITGFSNIVLGRFCNVDANTTLLRSLAKAGVARADVLADEVTAWLLVRTGTYASGMYEEALGLFTSIRDYFGQSGDSLRQVGSFEGLACAYSGLGLYMKAIESIDLALQNCQECNQWQSLHRLLLARAVAVSDLGYHSVAEKLFTDCARYCESAGNDYALARCLCYNGQMPRHSFEGRGARQTNHRIGLLRRSMEVSRSIDCLPIEFMASMAAHAIFTIYEMNEEIVEEEARLTRLSKELAKVGSGNVANEWVTESQEKVRGRDLRASTLTRSVVESSPDAMFVFDVITAADGSILDYRTDIRNSAADRLVLGTRNEMYSLSLLADLPFLRNMPGILKGAAADGQSYEDEIECEIGDKRTWFLRRVVPIDTSVAICLTDTTRFHEAASKADESAERARHADEAKSRFLATMSHEIRTPISGILGLARMLSSSDLDEQEKAWVNGIISGADILLGVIGGVLDLSKIEAGRLELDPCPVDPAALLKNLHALYLGQATAKGIWLRCKVGANLPGCVALDRVKIGQVLANLVNNAVKFTEQGGVEISVESDGANLVFGVFDTGAGIAADAVDRIFDPFEQVRTPKSTGGTGLGLTIARKMVELMGGNLTVESQLGEGSRFTFAIPIEVATPELEVEQPDTAVCEFDGCRVLLAEDNPTNAMVAKFQLEKLGCEVKVAVNGRLAVIEAVAANWDLILMDMHMPEMDGVEATKKIRRFEAGQKHTPILALTANALSQEREACLSAGMDDFLTKPIPPNAVREVLRKWIPALRIAA